MACLDNETATAYLRGDLDTEESRRWASHIACCSPCQRVVARVSALMDGVRLELMFVDVDLERSRWPGADDILRVVQSEAGVLPRLGVAWVPRFVTGMVLVVVPLVAWWILSNFGYSQVSAAELLQASSSAELSRAPSVGFVGHRTYIIAERRLPATEPRTTQHVEVWLDPKTNVSVRRVFDDQRRLIAGEWISPDGSRVVYERGHEPRREASSDPKPLTARSVWRWEPHAQEFASLNGPKRELRARSGKAGFVLALVPSNGVVAEAELLLDTQYLPLSQRIVLRSQDGTLVEFSTARQTREELPASVVAAAAFQPDHELLPPAATPIVAQPVSVPIPVAADFDGVELEAVYGMTLLAADCLAQPGEWTKTPVAFAVRIVVKSEACKESAEGLFATLAATPNVMIDVTVADSPIGRPLSGSFTASPEASPLTVQRTPIYTALQKLSSSTARRLDSSSADMDESALMGRVQAFAHRLQLLSKQLLARTTELRLLRERWSPELLQRLGVESSHQWASLLKKHAHDAARDADALLAQLRPILDPSAEQTLKPAQAHSGPDGSRELSSTTGPMRVDQFLNSDRQVNLTAAGAIIAELDAHATEVEHVVRRMVSPSDEVTEPPDPGSESTLAWLKQISQLARFLAEYPIALEP